MYIPEVQAVDMAHLLASQCSVDMFLLDWERPVFRVCVGVDREQGTLETKEMQAGSVSVWRTYFVANEWANLQTYRRVNLAFQTVTCLLLLKIYLVTTNLLRFQIFSRKLVLEQFVQDKLQHFVDLCSVSNVSLPMLHCPATTVFVVVIQREIVDVQVSMFILSHRRFGYYIHGRSSSGRADASLKEMHEFFQREEVGFCVFYI
ncbi:TMEM67 [Cordylochernes scorpioides]|uniref:TMEM67 n=1 Tax=Cordylochernes scorpioides TaxID=51811 RepID=A0ABY6LNX0_9ARAC|nr:TMEM67 [Cordylochernes scorpioides]